VVVKFRVAKAAKDRHLGTKLKFGSHFQSTLFISEAFLLRRHFAARKTQGSSSLGHMTNTTASVSEMCV